MSLAPSYPFAGPLYLLTQAVSTDNDWAKRGMVRKKMLIKVKSTLVINSPLLKE
jgi:hypothetical protein